MSETGGLGCKEFCTLSHSKEFADETLDHSESLSWGGTEFWGLHSSTRAALKNSRVMALVCVYIFLKCKATTTFATVAITFLRRHFRFASARRSFAN